MIWVCTVRGNPAPKKTHNRAFQRKGRIVVLPSKTFTDWERHAALQLRSGWYSAGHMKPLADEVSVAALFFRGDERHVDLVNLFQALADCLQTATVIENDRQIRAWDGSRLYVDRLNPRVEITLSQHGRQ